MGRISFAAPSRRAGLALCCAAAMAGSGAAAQQVAPQTAAEAVAVEAEPIPVAADAPAGSSGQIASGAAAGVLVGLAVVAVLLSSMD
jgi:hypothetical protein